MGSKVTKVRGVRRAVGLPIENNHGYGYGPDGYVVSPEAEDSVQGSDFKGDQQCLVQEEIPASGKTKSLVDPVTCQTDEAAADGHVNGHFGDGVVHAAHDARVQGVGEQQRERTGLVEGAADADEESGTDGASNGNKLDLAVAQMALQIIRVVVCFAMLNVLIGVWARLLDVRVVLFGFVNIHGSKAARGAVVACGCSFRVAVAVVVAAALGVEVAVEVAVGEVLARGSSGLEWLWLGTWQGTRCEVRGIVQDKRGSRSGAEWGLGVCLCMCV